MALPVPGWAKAKGFMVRSTAPKFFSRKPKTDSHQAINKDGETVSFAINSDDLDTCSDQRQRV